MRLFLTAVGAIFAAGIGWFIAMIIGAVASGLTADYLPNVRVYEGLLGAIGGAIAGGCLAYQGKHNRRYGFGLFSRVALFGSGLPLLRLALYQDTGLSAIIFFLMAGSLFSLGSLLILDIVLQTEALADRLPSLTAPIHSLHEMGLIPVIIYLPLGLAMALAGAYATGGIELNCQRFVVSARIDCELVESRWLDQRKTMTLLPDVRDSTYEFGDMILHTGSDDVLIEGGIINDIFIVDHAFQTFLTSTKPTLAVRLEPRWIFFGVVLLAGVLVWLGLNTEPITAQPLTNRWLKTRMILQLFRSPALIFGLVALAWGISFYLLILPATQRRIAEDNDTLRLVSTTMLDTIPDGTKVFVEGQLSENNETSLREFVMYTVSRYTSDGWQAYSAKDMTPPFWLDLPGDGSVSSRRLWVGNDTYGLEMTYEPPLQWEPTETTERERLRYRGYGRSNFVTIEGQIEREAGEPYLFAWLVYSEPIETITQGSQVGFQRAGTVGGILLIIGLILLGIFGRGFVMQMSALSAKSSSKHRPSTL